MRAARPVLVYLLLAVAMTWPVALHPMSMVTGFPNIDASDTIMLRGLVADAVLGRGDTGIYYPVGFPAWQLTPNLLDHLTALPFVALLPFPLADNAWWLGILVATGLAAHRLGRRLGKGEDAAWLCGVAFMLSEPVAREANLTHGPQSMLLWAPLYLDAVINLRRTPSSRGAALAGLWLALAALSYWYYGLFLGLGSLALLVRVPLAQLGVMGLVTGLVSLPGMLPIFLHWSDLPIVSADKAPVPLRVDGSYDVVPEDLRFVTQHGNDPIFWLRTTPLDTANRLSLLALVAVALGWRDCKERWGLLFMAGLASVMVLGPFLRWDDTVVINADDLPMSLPFRWLANTHHIFNRLTWPERWGMLISLAMLPVLARAPRPKVFAVLVAVESFLVSGNLPLQHTDMSGQTCWSALAGNPGAIVDLPLDRPVMRAARVGIHHRMHKRPTVNPVVLPPGTTTPIEWRDWFNAQPMLKYLQVFEGGTWPKDPGARAVRALSAEGVTAFVVDAEPEASLTAGGISRYQAGLSRHFGRPIDLGCALVWWLDEDNAPPLPIADGKAWRDEFARHREAEDHPELDTLIEVIW